jgi:hypothetical protein
MKLNKIKRKTQKKREQSHDILKVYSNKDYESNDGMLTAVWGPSAWHFLHTISFNYPVNPTENEKKNYMDYILSLQYVLPCGKCRKNFKNNLKKLPINMEKMENRTTFSKYIYDLHEVINDMLHKKSNLTFEEVRERYEHFRARCVKRNKTEKRVRFSKRVSILGNKQQKTEKGCIVPLYGEKSKCVLQIVPQDTKCDTFQIDDKCVKKRLILS